MLEKQLELEQCYFEDLISDYEHWMDKIHMQSDIISFTKYVDDDKMNNLLQCLHAAEDHLNYIRMMVIWKMSGIASTCNSRKLSKGIAISILQF